MIPSFRDSQLFHSCPVKIVLFNIVKYSTSFNIFFFFLR